MRHLAIAIGAIALVPCLWASATSTDTLTGPVVLELRDGQRLTGSLGHSADSTRLLLSIGSPDTLLIPKAAVGSIHKATPQGAHLDSKPDDSLLPSNGWSPDPSATRGLALPNGYMLKQGSGFYVQNELLISQVGYGITDWFNVVGGSALPLLFVPEGANLMVAGKIGGSAGPLHASVGWMQMFLPGGNFGAPYAALNIGTETFNFSTSYAHLTLSGSDESLDWSSFGAYFRTGKHAALLGEAWMLKSSEEQARVVFAPGIRLMSGGLSGDLAFVFIKESSVPLPWVNVAYAF